METKVTLFELIVSSGGAIIAIIGAWVHMRITVAGLKTELGYIKKELESEKQGNKDSYLALNGKIDSIYKILTEIQVTIAKK